jgi:hypothetical protein
MLIAMLLILPIAIPRATFLSEEAEASGGNNAQVLENRSYAQQFSADLLAIVVPPDSTRFVPSLAKDLHDSFAGNRYEATIFPGVIMLLALGGLAFTQSSLRLPIWSAVLALWVFSLGPVLHIAGRALVDGAGQPLDVLPAVLLQHLPGLESLRTPSRIAFALPILSAVALAVVGDRVVTSVASSRVLRAAVGALAVVLLGSNLLSPVTSSRELDAGLTHALATIALDADRTDAVLEVPADPSSAVETIRFQMIHHRPTLGFHGQWAALPWFSGFETYKTSEPLAQLRCLPRRLAYATTRFPNTLVPHGDELRRLRQELGVRYLLINDARLALSECTRRKAIEAILDTGSLVGAGDGWRVVEVPSP